VTIGVEGQRKGDCPGVLVSREGVVRKGTPKGVDRYNSGGTDEGKGRGQTSLRLDERHVWVVETKVRVGAAVTSRKLAERKKGGSGRERSPSGIS